MNRPGWAEIEASKAAMEARWQRRLDDVERVCGYEHAAALEFAVLMKDEPKAKRLLDEYMKRKAEGPTQTGEDAT